MQLRQNLASIKSGFNIFRLILDEAIAFAKKEGLEKVTLLADGAVAEYYKSFGFKFNNPKEPYTGVFYLKRKKRG